MQTYVIFLARLKNLDFAPGPESLECRLFALDEIPFDSLAFSSIYYLEDLKKGKVKFHSGPEEPFLLGHESHGERFRRRKRGIEKSRFISTLSSSCSLIDEGGEKITASSPRRTKSKKGFKSSSTK
ncbi:hypothetical protein Bca52824_063526 [Brassica carinata]|uniref:Uncharacterized protein n=1 Tax=Brassica carinata TaxID=52824 RepID=A0A8X7UAE0_BRACI|nr:hypothetical protein Bca52824_063526 [Brassica carinata]